MAWWPNLQSQKSRAQETEGGRFGFQYHLGYIGRPGSLPPKIKRQEHIPAGEPSTETFPEAYELGNRVFLRLSRGPSNVWLLLCLGLFHLAHRILGRVYNLGPMVIITLEILEE